MDLFGWAVWLPTLLPSRGLAALSKLINIAGQNRGAVTDGDPNYDHEPPFGADVLQTLVTSKAVQNRSICAPGVTLR
jgi:hypothetical protein